MWYNGNSAIEDLGVNFIPDQYEFNKEDTNGFIKNVKERNLLPLDKLEIYYSDDYWDFGGYQTTNISATHYHFDFSKTHDCFKDDLKNYVLVNVIEARKKINVIKSEFRFIQQFMQYCTEIGVFEIQHIDSGCVKKWVESSLRQCSEKSNQNKVSAIRSFCEYYNANFKNFFPKEFYDDINGIIDVSLLKAESENGKTPDIPANLFNEIIAATISTIDDKEAPVYYRALACMLLMQSQVGLRTGELFNLRVGCVKIVTTANGDTAYYIEYKTWKRHHGTKKSSTEISYVNDLFKKDMI